MQVNPPELWLKWYRLTEEEYTDGLNQMLDLQQPALKQKWTLTHAASAGTLPEASNAHLAVEEDSQSDRTPKANQIHLQAGEQCQHWER